VTETGTGDLLGFFVSSDGNHHWEMAKTITGKWQKPSLEICSKTQSSNPQLYLRSML
jgi:hypothetical protein